MNICRHQTKECHNKIFSILHYLRYMFDRESAKKVDTTIQDSLFIMAVSNSCMNPLVYGSYAIKCQMCPCNSSKKKETKQVGSAYKLELQRRSTGNDVCYCRHPLLILWIFTRSIYIFSFFCNLMCVHLDGVIGVVQRDNKQQQYIKNLSCSYPMYPENGKGKLSRLLHALN